MDLLSYTRFWEQNERWRWIGRRERELMVLLARDPKILKFRCSGCNLTVEREAFSIQVWADAHCFDCLEERSKIHVLDEAGRIREPSG